MPRGGAPVCISHAPSACGEGGGGRPRQRNTQGRHGAERGRQEGEKGKGTKGEWYKGCAQTARQQGDRTATERTQSSAVLALRSTASGRQEPATPGVRVAQQSQHHSMSAHRRRSKQRRGSLPGQPTKSAHMNCQGGRVLDVQRTTFTIANREEATPPRPGPHSSPPAVATPHPTNTSPSRQPPRPNIHLLLPPPRRRHGTQPPASPASNATSAVTDGRHSKQRKKHPGTPPTPLPPSPPAPARERLAAPALLTSRGKRSASPGPARDEQTGTPRAGRHKPAPADHACVTPGAAVSTAEPSDSRRSWPGRS